MKAVVIMIFCIPLMINSLQKDEISIVAAGIPEVRVPIEQIPLVSDQTDYVLVGGVTTSLMALGLAGIYRLAADPPPFNIYECRTNYYLSLSNQSKETDYPCKWGYDFQNCLYDLVVKSCEIAEVQYDQTLPSKRLNAWIPFMVTATA